MGAKPNVQARPSLRKVPSSEPAKPSRLDQFGRDSQSPSEQLRSQTNYDTDTGYSPLFHGMLADLSRLLGGSAVGWALVMNILRLSLGRGFDGTTKQRHSWTPGIALEDLSDLCRCDIRQLQRQIAELSERGVLQSKSPARGMYAFMLCIRAWRELDDYAVWKRKQAVPISTGEPEQPEDEAVTEVSRDAVRLTKRPQTARPGRALRAMNINVGVRKLRCENASSAANVAFEARIEPGGEVVVSATISAAVAIEAVPEPPAPSKGKPVAAPSHLLAKHVGDLFNPILERYGVPFLTWDAVAWNLACDELGEMPMEYLVHFVMRPKGRASRSIATARTCVSIIKEARLNWEQSRPKCHECGDSLGTLENGRCSNCSVLSNIHACGELLQSTWETAEAKAEHRKYLESASVNPDFTTEQQDAARRLLEILA